MAKRGMFKMDGYWPSSLFAFFFHKTQKRTRSSPAILSELARSIKDSMPSCCFVFSLLCLPVFIEKCILETHQRSSILRERSQKLCLLSRKIFSKRKFLCIRLDYGEIYCKNNTGNPERTVSLHPAHSGYCSSCPLTEPVI